MAETASMEIECRVCGDTLKTGNVEKVIAFDREHIASCCEKTTPTPGTSA